MFKQAKEVVYDQVIGVGFAFANRLTNCSIAKVLGGPDSPDLLSNFVKRPN